MSRAVYLGTAYDWLLAHAAVRPDETAVAEWHGGTVTRQVTFRQLEALATRAAGALVGLGTSPGDRLVIALPNGVPFIATLLATFAAGLIAVPAPPPERGAAPFVSRFRGIVADCRPALVVTHAVDEFTRDLMNSACRAVMWEDLAVSPSGHDAPPECVRRHHETALLQYTSGSTGKPRGAAISHRAVAGQCVQAAEVYRESVHDTAVTWVPLFHDMGLVTGVLRPLHRGYRSVLLTPGEFAARPSSWLAALSSARGTLSSAPDFAFSHCVRRMPAADVSLFDLTAWRVARDAGEPVRVETADRFTAHFARAGFDPRAFCPSYGLAEATLTVTASAPERPALRLTVSREALRSGVGVAGPASPEAPEREASAHPEEFVTLLSSGLPLPGTEVSVRDADGRRLPEGRIGDVWIRGPQLFEGYWSSVAGRVNSRSGEYATGDYGFLFRSHLFVLGRADDTLVHKGRNFYAADVIDALDGVSGLRRGRAVVFTVDRPVPSTRGAYGAPCVCLVAELDDAGHEDGERIALRARQSLAATLGLHVGEVALVAPGALPRTTSGKVRLPETHRRYRCDDLPVVHVSPLRLTDA
ncbi:AMP-binding protein [Streptomyces umbrinus]